MPFFNYIRKQYLLLVPLAGIVVFIILYPVATSLYPGGSQADKNAVGFSWLNNYWCNLLNVYAMNGDLNKARPVALTAMAFLCIALAVFWLLFPLHAGLGRKTKLITQVCGIMAMGTGFFLFTDLHDQVINAATLCGLASIAGTFAGLHRLRWRKLIGFGLFNLFLVVVNNILYYGDGLLLYLPVVQKITFLSFLLWISFIDVQLYKRAETGVGR